MGPRESGPKPSLLHQRSCSRERLHSAGTAGTGDVLVSYVHGTMAVRLLEPEPRGPAGTAHTQRTSLHWYRRKYEVRARNLCSHAVGLLDALFGAEMRPAKTGKARHSLLAHERAYTITRGRANGRAAMGIRIFGTMTRDQLRPA